jgi:hypothetical protein
LFCEQCINRLFQKSKTSIGCPICRAKPYIRLYL